MINISKKDLNKIKKKLNKESYLRITLVKSGCTGFEYKFIEDKNFDKKKDCICLLYTSPSPRDPL